MKFKVQPDFVLLLSFPPILLEGWDEVAVLIMAGDKDGFIGSVQRLDERMKSLNIAHEYQELPGLDHGSIVTGGMTNVFQFFGQHTKP